MDELKNIPIFALEGSAFAGKTTLLNYIKDNFGDKINVIPEVGEYVGGDKNFPDIPFKTIADAKFSTCFFEAIEKYRYKDMVTKYKLNGNPILIDRFTFLSSLIFYKLLLKNKIQSKEMHQETFKHAKRVFSQNIENLSVMVPKGFILIKHLDEKTFNSRLSRGTKNSVFTSWDNCKYVNSLYDNYFSNFPSKSILELKSSNSNLEQNSKKILEFIDKNKSSTKKLLISGLLETSSMLQVKDDKDIIMKASKRANELIKQNLK